MLNGIAPGPMRNRQVSSALRAGASLASGVHDTTAEWHMEGQIVLFLSGIVFFRGAAGEADKLKWVIWIESLILAGLPGRHTGLRVSRKRHPAGGNAEVFGSQSPGERWYTD